MKSLKIPQNSDAWLEFRKGRITGSKLHDIITKRGGGKKIGFYQLIADRLAIDDGETSSRDRGHEMEEEAIDYFEAEVGIKVERDPGVWISDIDENIAISPDGAIKNKDGDYTEAVEVKCFGSALHLLAIIENKIPYKYFEQAIQYFVVNEKLERLHFVFFDPRVTSRPMHIIEMYRDDYLDDIQYHLDYEKQILQEVNEWAEKLAF